MQPNQLQPGYQQSPQQNPQYQQYQQPYSQPLGSYFDGKLGQWVGYNILCARIILFALGIAAPWGICLLYEWEIKHTVIEGRRLRFDGTGGQLFGKYIIWMLLTIITIGIYSFWLGIKLRQWKTSHTFFAN